MRTRSKVFGAHQPNFIPYLGFFDKAIKCDVFVLLDCVEFSKQNWQNRNKIRTSDGWMWLTLPIKKGSSKLPIRLVELSEGKWRKRIWKSIMYSYNRAPHWENYHGEIQELVTNSSEKLLDYNIAWLEWLFKELDIACQVVPQSELDIQGKASELILRLGKALSCDVYLSGVGAKDYLDEKLLMDEGIDVVSQNFKHPEYKQVFEPFIPHMSVLDGILNIGPKLNLMLDE